jgi:hypothetical protein
MLINALTTPYTVERRTYVDPGSIFRKRFV